MLVVLLVTRSARAQQQRTTVALDLTHLSDADYAALDGLALERGLVLRLVEEGFAVVATTSQPAIVLRIEVQGEVIQLKVEATGDSYQRDIQWDRRIERPLLHLELSQKLVELARAARAAAPAPESASPAAAARPPARSQRHEEARSASEGMPPSQGSASIGVAIGGVWRPPALDPALRLGLLLRAGGRWWMELGTGVLAASAPGIRVMEIEPSAGLNATLRLDARWALSAGARIGILMHVYSLDDSAAAQASGLRLDGLIAAPLRASVRAFQPVLFDLTVAPGVATRGRSHLANGRTLWHRSAGQVEVTLGAALAF
jgi:hypothetical protein